MIKLVSGIAGVYAVLFTLLIGVAYIGSGSGSAKHYTKNRTQIAKSIPVVKKEKTLAVASNNLPVAKNQYYK